MNRSRPVEPPEPGVTTKDRVDIPLAGILTKDAPGPLEAFFRRRMPGQHAIPYEQLTVRKGLAVYDAMLQNDDVSYGHGLKRTCLMAAGWSIAAPEDKEGDPIPEAERVLDHVIEQVERWDRFDEFLEQMFDGTRQGFKLGEVVTKDGKIDGKSAWVVDDVLVRNSRFYAFDTDPSGRILGDGILEYIDPNPDGGGFQSVWSPNSVARHDPDKFVRWSWNGLDSNAYSLYGRSDFYAAYRLYFLEDVMMKGWAETLDSYKHPTAIGIARKGLTTTQQTNFLEALVQGLKRKAIVVPEEFIPDGMDPEKAIRMHEVTGKAQDFEGMIGKLDTKIMRALFVGQLVAETGGDGKGSYALGKQHVSIFLKIMDAVGRSLGRAIANGLFKKMVRWNLGEEFVELTPTLKFNAAGDSETLERTQVIGTLIDAGLIDPSEGWVREYLGNFPKMDPEVQKRVEKERELRLKAETTPKPAPGGGGSKLSAEEPPKLREVTKAQADELALVVDDVAEGTISLSEGVMECGRIAGLSRAEACELLRPSRPRPSRGREPTSHMHIHNHPPAATPPAAVHLKNEITVQPTPPAPIQVLPAPPAPIVVKASEVHLAAVEPPKVVVNNIVQPAPVQVDNHVTVQPAPPAPPRDKKVERGPDGRVAYLREE